MHTPWDHGRAAACITLTQQQCIVCIASICRDRKTNRRTTVLGVACIVHQLLSLLRKFWKNSKTRAVVLFAFLSFVYFFVLPFSSNVTNFSEKPICNQTITGCSLKRSSTTIFAHISLYPKSKTTQRRRRRRQQHSVH